MYPIESFLTEFSRINLKQAVLIQAALSIPLTLINIWICIKISTLIRKNDLLALIMVGSTKILNTKK